MLTNRDVNTFVHNILENLAVCLTSQTTPAQDLHIWLLHLRDRLRPVTRTADETVGLHNQRIYVQTGKIINVPVILTWPVCSSASTDVSGQMLTFAGEVCCSRMNQCHDSFMVNYLRCKKTIEQGQVYTND